MLSRKKELAKNTVILTVGKICTQFVSFMLLPLYTALLVPEEFGIVDLFNTYIALLVPLFNWQFESGLFRFMLDCRDDKLKQKELFSTVIIANAFQIILYLVFYVIFQEMIQSQYKIFLALDVALNIVLNTMLQLSRGLGKTINYSVASFLSATVTVIFNVVFIAGLKMGALGMFLATVIAKILTLVYLLIALHSWEYFSVKIFNKGILKDVCKYSVPLIPNQLSWWVVGTSDRTIITYFVGLTANGVYSVANKFSTVFITFYNIFNLSWTESVSLHISDEDGDVFLTETINDMFNLFAAVDMGIIACMPLVFPLMVNEQYVNAYYQIPILMLAVLFQVLVGLYSVIYVALKKSAEIAKTTFYAAVINIVVDLLLVRFVGLYAASISTLVAYAAMAIYRYFDVKKYMNVPLKKKSLMITFIIGMATLLSYYNNNMICNVIVLLIVVIYAYLINRQLIHSIFNQIVKKLRKN